MKLSCNIMEEALHNPSTAVQRAEVPREGGRDGTDTGSRAPQREGARGGSAGGAEVEYTCAVKYHRCTQEEVLVR